MARLSPVPAEGEAKCPWVELTMPGRSFSSGCAGERRESGLEGAVLLLEPLPVSSKSSVWGLPMSGIDTSLPIGCKSNRAPQTMVAISRAWANKRRASRNRPWVTCKLPYDTCASTHTWDSSNDYGSRWLPPMPSQLLPTYRFGYHPPGWGIPTSPRPASVSPRPTGRQRLAPARMPAVPALAECLPPTPPKVPDTTSRNRETSPLPCWLSDFFQQSLHPQESRLRLLKLAIAQCVEDQTAEPSDLHCGAPCQPCQFCPPWAVFLSNAIVAPVDHGRVPQGLMRTGNRMGQPTGLLVPTVPTRTTTLLPSRPAPGRDHAPGLSRRPPTAVPSSTRPGVGRPGL